MSDPFARLDDLEAHVWDRMVRGARDAADPFRLVTLATMGGAGPEARVVGLRRADRASGEVEVHSDLRTAKVRAVGAEPRAALLFWDPATQVQVRLSVALRLLPAAADRWARIPAASRQNYGTDPAPGTPVASPGAVRRTPEIARFAALVGRVRRIDALSLAHDPHRRAVFADGAATWVAP